MAGGVALTATDTERDPAVLGVTEERADLSQRRTGSRWAPGAGWDRAEDLGATEEPGDLFVTPTGGPSAPGTERAPLDLATALAGGRVKPGQTVWVGGGTYRGCFVSKVAGKAALPVVIRQRPGERAVIDGRGCTQPGTLMVKGADVWFWGLEVMSSDPERVTTTPGSNPDDLDRPAGVFVQAPRTKFINMVVHDNGNGFAFWKQAVDSEIYGAVIYNNGWIGPDRGHGHGV
ncbi:MAG: hypothetical protein ACRDJP_12880, partial [Actinomycetota bacterium]